MFLEKLEIQGFKSFANKNKLIFSGILKDQKRGITAIVGPNGSGKSNVADAVRWALGEQSLKTLRGKKTEDVIFSGSDKKARLSFAEVSLFLNNEDKLDLNYEELIFDADNPELDQTEQENKDKLDQILRTQSEIVITRRAYRDGENEYLLNGSRVRLSDIQMLLAKANVGHKTYSVIGQGMVENFLNSSAAERKDFFDEATGVKQFQIKRDLALNRLESSYENLQQVDLLLSEIKPRLKSLTRQIDRLKKRDYLEENLQVLQLNYYSFTWQSINKKLNTLNQNYLEIENQKIDLESKIGKINRQLETIQSAEINIKINELQPIWRDLDEQKNQQERRLAKLQLDLEADLEAQGNFDISWLNNKAQELKTELNRINLDISSLDNSRPNNKRQVLNNKLTELEEKIKQISLEQDQIRNIEREIFILKQTLVKTKEEENFLLESNQALDLKSLKEERNRINLELTEIENKLAEKNQTLSELQRKKLEQEKKLSELNQEFKEINQTLNRLANNLEKSSELSLKNQEIYQLVEKFLEELAGIEEIFDIQTIKNLINQSKKEFSQKIQSILKLEPGSDAFLWQESQNKLLTLVEDRQKLSEKLQNNQNKINELQNDLFSLRQEQAKSGISLKEIKENLEKVEDESHLEALRQKTFDLEKEIELSQINLDSLKDKTTHLEMLEKDKALTLSDLHNCQVEDSLISEKINLRQERKRTLDLELSEINEKLERNKNKISAPEIQLKIKDVENLISKLNQDISKVDEELKSLQSKQAEEKNLMFAHQKDLQQKQTLLNELNENLNNLKIQAAREETRLEDLEKNIYNDKLSLKEIKEHVAEGSSDLLSEWQNSINNYKRQLEQIGSIDPETEEEYEETKTRYDFLSQQTLDLNGAIKSLEHVIYKLDLNIKSIFDKEFKLISEKFNEYFQILFNGGSAKISKIILADLEKENKEQLTNQEFKHPSSDQEELQFKIEDNFEKLKLLKKYNSIGLQGIEIQATPPGKKIQSIAMLSGGERALTAIALICAIISANPSPFVILDEVDAALDESNSERLAKILDDLSSKTQFVVITHNRASMRTANILYGITMSADGVSQLISVKLDDLLV